MSLFSDDGATAFDLLCEVSRELSAALLKQGLTEADIEKISLHSYWDPGLFNDNTRANKIAPDPRAYWIKKASLLAEKHGCRFPVLT